MVQRKITTAISWLSRMLREVRPSFDKPQKFKIKQLCKLLCLDIIQDITNKRRYREEDVDAKV